MRRLGISVGVVVSWAAGGVVGCGGSGHGFRTSANPVVITSTALPATLSGQLVNYPIEFSGGAGGPYILDKIDGNMPDGVTLNSSPPSLGGRALEDGIFDFTLRLTDTGSDPFSVSIKSFHWVIGIGNLVFATDPILPSIVFNQFVTLPLVVAGGVPPYSCTVIDDPTNPNDELPPTGLIIPTDSCSFVGAAVSVKPVVPSVYHVSVQARDHADQPAFPNPATVIQQFDITVLVPPVIITTVSVANGKCGTVYSDQISVADGIPPFKHSIVVANGSTTRVQGFAPSLNPSAKGVGNSAYSTDITAGPYTGRWPEGMYIRDTTGGITGTPRRTGIFNNWNYHVQSTVLPNVPSQNAWKTFSFSMADSTPPAVALDNSVLLAGNTFSAGSPGTNNFLQDATAGQPYLKQFSATGGVPYDGFSDAPHETERVADSTEAAGRFQWSASLAGNTFAAIGMKFIT